MLMMRLKRVGRKNNPSYRIVVVDKRTSVKSNKITDLIGTYNPKGGETIINAEKARYWLAHGTQASDTVHNMLVSKKIIDAKKRNSLSRKSPIINEEKVKAEAAAEDVGAEAKVAAEAPVETPAEAEVVAEAPAEEVAEAPVEAETPSEVTSDTPEETEIKTEEVTA